MLSDSNAPKSVLMVCLGNICRSPTAEEVFRQRTALGGLNIKVDSAGTSHAHMGEHPHPKTQKYAKAHGYRLRKLVARQVTEQDLYDFDLILAMDTTNLADLQAIKDKLIIRANHQADHQVDQDINVEFGKGNMNQSDIANDSSDKLATLAMLSEVDISHLRQDVPDPYQGSSEDFEEVIDRVESAVDAWIVHWTAN